MLRLQFFTPHQMDLITAAVTDLCLELRQCAVPLVDSFNYSDHIVSVRSHSREVTCPVLIKMSSQDQLATGRLQWRRLQGVL